MSAPIAWKGYNPRELGRDYEKIVAQWAMWEKQMSGSSPFAAAQIDDPKPQLDPSAPYGQKEPVIVIKMLDKRGSVLDIVHIDRKFNVTKTANRKARQARRATRGGKPRAPFQRVRLVNKRKPARKSRPGESKFTHPTGSANTQRLPLRQGNPPKA